MDPGNPPRLTEQQRAELKKLGAAPDGSIDDSDIPELGEEFWRDAVRNPYYRPVKQQVTIRLDTDLIAWFKRHTPDGRGYQTGINRALRAYVEQQEKGKKAG